MIKRSLLFLTVVLLYSSSVMAQQWTFQGVFPPLPDTMALNSGIQYVVVDNNDKIWMNAYATVGDSLFVPDSNKYKTVRPVLVFNPDGSLLQKISSITYNGVLYPFYSTGYGLEKDHNGNILVVKASTVYRINYQTFEGMNEPLSPFGSSTCSPAVDAAGNIYFTAVLPGFPLKKYDENFQFVANIADTIPNYGRCTQVSGDGYTVYAPRFGGKYVIRFRTTNDFDPYVPDTILKGAQIESGTWDNVDPTKLWFSVGSIYDKPLAPFLGRQQTYLMFDTTMWNYTDSIKYQITYSADSTFERPRGLAFSKDGPTAYLVSFGGTALSPGANAQYHTNPQHVVVGVVKEPGMVVDNYALEQNYPNPFNPTTAIKFSVVNPGMVTLKVYDLLGKEVATLVNEELSNGQYTANFDASKLASGTYVYRLTAGTTQISRKMMLLK